MDDSAKRLWIPIPCESDQQEDLENRPALSYAQDSWRRLRQNHMAMISMIFILLIVSMAVCFPLVWPLTYSYQRLDFANLPPLIKLYPLANDQWLYISKEYKAIEFSARGEALRMAELIKDDKAARKKLYRVAAQTLEINFSAFFEAKKELTRLSRKAQKEGGLKVSELRFLDHRELPWADDALVPFAELENYLEKQIPRVLLLCGDEPLEKPLLKWNRSFIFGSDSLGRDLFIRVIYGARMSLTVGILAAFINFIIGVLYGGISGYVGGRLDNLMMRFVDIISSIPMMLYVILIMVLIGPGLKSIIFAMSITYWVGMARLVRAQVLSLKTQEFILAIRLLGGSNARILLRHLVPNIMGPIMVSLSMQIPSAMFTEAFLSFTGLGVAAPQASWGTLCNDALQGLSTYPYQMFFPALAMSLSILAFNLFSDGLRDALDPKLRK